MIDRLAASLADRYRLEREIGQGGMATVYLAHDLKHDRDVAIKVLHPDLGAALGGERFLSEIKTTAKLQHPHILPLLDSGEADGLLYYVMPVVTGETLRARLAHDKQLPMDEALRITREVADALGYAHAQGVIHRDIKPENILLQDEHALVADFGIALAVQSAGGQRMTQTGLSLGTPQYMSPEQAMGERTVDARSDIYALGAVAYEMLVGDPPFTGSTVQAIVAKVLTEKPTAPSAVRDTVSPGVEAAVLRALAKLPADRFASARAFVDALSHEAPALTGARGGAAATRTVTSPRLLAALGVLATATLLASIGWWRATDDRSRAPSVQVGVEVPPGARIVEDARAVTISADGRTVAMAVESGDGRRSLVVRRLGDVAVEPLAGTEGANQPSFSPDGEWIAFVSGQRLKKVPIRGGAAVVLADVGDVQGIGWGPAGLIFVSNDARLAVVPDGGGELRRLEGSTTPSGSSERFPIPLPDGKSVLFTLYTGGASNTRVMRRTLDNAPAVAVEGALGAALGVAADRLLLGGAGGVLRIATVDAAVARLTGPMQQAMDGVAVADVPVAAISRTGTLLFRPGSQLSDLVLAGPRGDTLVVGAERRDYQEPRLSPDGRRIAVQADDRRGADIWVIDRASGASARVTNDGRSNMRAEWSPDGTRLLYHSLQDSVLSLWWRAWDGSNEPARLQSDPRRGIREASLSPDGTWLLFRTGSSSTADIWYRRLTGDTTVHAFAASPGEENEARFSPDGRWVAYTSDQSGLTQVFVRPFPTGDLRLQVTVAGGGQPIWSRDGRSLYYTGPNGIVIIRARLSFQPAPTVVSRDTVIRRGYFVPERNGHAMYDVAPDGERLLLVRRVPARVPAVIALGWLDDVREKLSREGKP